MASLKPTPGAGLMSGDFPSSSHFTLAFTDETHVVVGAQGQGALAAVMRDGDTFHVVGAVPVGAPNASTCSTATDLSLQSFDFTLSGTTLQGHGAGKADISCGDCEFTEPFTFEAVAGPDKTPPTLVGSAREIDPFAEFSLGTSEPLSPAATAKLVDSNGASADLVPLVPNAAGGGDAGVSEPITGFTKPNVVLPTGGGYSVQVDGLVDYAGLHGLANAALRLGSFPEPPVLAADGFESATGSTLGGAAVITAGEAFGDAGAGALAPITGTRSIYVARSGVPFATNSDLNARFLARLAVPAGATKVSFSYQQASNFAAEAFSGRVFVGSVGHTAASSYAFAQPTSSTSTPIGNGVTVFLGAPQSFAIDLPSDHTDEVVFEIASTDVQCSLGRAQVGLLVDDLRVE
ncbi:MAG TPA: hypothetical protein VHJ20_01240 [Polyangia bacterium]|nr:hypothetical protein [Polyangia bacterium]